MYKIQISACSQFRAGEHIHYLKHYIKIIGTSVDTTSSRKHEFITSNRSHDRVSCQSSKFSCTY